MSGIEKMNAIQLVCECNFQCFYVGIYSVPSTQLDVVPGTAAEWYNEYGNANANLGSVAGNYSSATLYGCALGQMLNSLSDVIQE